LDIIGVLNI